ncbi:hypothetical protein D7316_04381 [Gordonia insulae]|uniref:Uncharacterized protein n=2 Tax=Gordonia insulae TaxID=2420509 RepID=A0A3G8JT86_9ACTN|nr:hypothetical protein D7316_04381 [Gordonia insulae]
MAVVIRSLVLAMAVMLIGLLPAGQAIAASPSGPGAGHSSNSGDAKSGKNKPSTSAPDRGGDARKIQPRAPQPAPRHSAPSSPGSPSAPGAGSPGGSQSSPAKPTRPRSSIPKPDRGPHKYSPNTKAPQTTHKDPSDRDSKRSRDKSDRPTGPQQNRAPNKVAPKTHDPKGSDQRERGRSRDSREPGDNKKDKRDDRRSDRAGTDRKKGGEPTRPERPPLPTRESTPRATTPGTPAPPSATPQAPQAPQAPEAPQTQTPRAPERRDQNPPAAILSPPMKQADPNEPSPKTPNITGRPDPKEGQPEAHAPPNPPAQPQGWREWYGILHGIGDLIEGGAWVLEQFFGDDDESPSAPENPPAEESPAPETPAPGTAPAEPAPPSTEQTPPPATTPAPPAPQPSAPAPSATTPPAPQDDTDGGSGRWVPESTNGWSQETKDYQEQVTGRPPGTTYEIPSKDAPSGKVSVDDVTPPTDTEKEKWTEVKYHRPDVVYDKDGNLQPWSKEARQMPDQLKRQYQAAEEHDAEVEWVVADERQLRDVQAEIDRSDYGDRITVRIEPPKK